MGLSSRNGKITARQFAHFVDSQVAPLFPGFTTQPAVGYWQGAKERSRILTIVHEGNSEAEAAIRQIRLSYCEKFCQESVMRLSAHISVEF
jgi:hypothetical protein